jgi:hypothetical protein
MIGTQVASPRLFYDFCLIFAIRQRMEGRDRSFSALLSSFSRLKIYLQVDQLSEVGSIWLITGIGSSIRRFANRPRPQFFASEVYCLEPVRLDHGQLPGNQFFDGRCFIY